MSLAEEEEVVVAVVKMGAAKDRRAAMMYVIIADKSVRTDGIGRVVCAASVFGRLTCWICGKDVEAHTYPRATDIEFLPINDSDVGQVVPHESNGRPRTRARCAARAADVVGISFTLPPPSDGRTKSRYLSDSPLSKRIRKQCCNLPKTFDYLMLVATSFCWIDRVKWHCAVQISGRHRYVVH